MKKYAIAGILACALLSTASFAQVIVRIAPPPVIVEHPGPPPRAGYIWTSGYHRWDGARYVWVPGRYAYPPRAHAVWVPHRWVDRHDHWEFQEGHWR